MAPVKTAPMAPEKPSKSFRPSELKEVKKVLFDSPPLRRVSFSKQVDVAPYGVRHYIGLNNGKPIWKTRSFQTPDAPFKPKTDERPDFCNILPKCLFK